MSVPRKWDIGSHAQDALNRIDAGMGLWDSLQKVPHPVSTCVMEQLRIECQCSVIVFEQQYGEAAVIEKLRRLPGKNFKESPLTVKKRGKELKVTA